MAVAAKEQCQERCINLTGEGGLSNACRLLTSLPPFNHTAEIAGHLAEKHPAAKQPVDLSEFGNARSSLAPLVGVDLIV